MKMYIKKLDDNDNNTVSFLVTYLHVGLGGLGVTCSPRDPRVQIWLRSMDFFQDVTILSTRPPGGALKWGSRV